MKNSNVKHRLPRLLAGLCGAALMFGLSACSDDLLLGTPEWLGTSIYEELESRGDYSVTLALINSAPVAADNYRELLSKTGSKTLFVADDAAWQRFFDKNKKLPAENPWSTITSTESFNASGNELKVRRLLKGMMLNNAYVLDLLGNLSSDPSSVNVEDAADACMRRNTSISNLDMRGEVKQENYPPEKLPNASGEEDIDWWEEVRDRSSITTMPAVLNGANNTKPANAAYLYTRNGDPDLPTMVHFSPSFAISNGFEKEDVSILSGGVANSTSQTVVNGVAIDPDNANITCQNGYIHKMVEVPYPVSNMMEKLSYEPKYSIFYKQLQRFSYPYKNQVQTDNLGGLADVYTIRYINSGNNAQHCELTQDYSLNKVANAYLPYDPAWNHYYLYNTSGSYTYQMDAALMLVPDDEHMTSFLTKEGKDLTDRYAPTGQASWDYFPDAIVAELMQNCMQTNFLSYLPHNVSKVKDTSQSIIGGLDTDKIADCFVCGNGVIYGLSMNIVPPTYRDVTSVMLLNKEKDRDESRDEGFSVFYNFIQKDKEIVSNSAGYASYLGSFDGTKYVLFCPYDKALRAVVDPSSWMRDKSGAEGGPILFRFDYDSESKNKPWIEPYSYTVDAYGVVTPGALYSQLASNDDFAPVSSASDWYKKVSYRMLRYIMENSVCPVYNFPDGPCPLEQAYTYYKTKSGSAIKVDWTNGGDITKAGYAGGYQVHYNRAVTSPAAIHKEGGNGVSLPVSEVLLPAIRTPYQTLRDDFPDFFKFIKTDNSQSKNADENEDKQTPKHKVLPGDDPAIEWLRPYNYTIYVPTKEAIDKQVNSYQVPRRVWIVDIGLTDEVIKTKFSGISDDDLNKLKDLRDKVIDVAIDNYLAYHIQDYGVFLGQRDTTGVFETSFLNTETNQFYGLHVEEHSSTSGATLEVYPKGYPGKTVRINSNVCNIQATQNYYTDSKNLGYGTLYTSSYVVVHQIADDEDLYMPPAANIWSEEKYNELKALFDKYGVALTEPVN